ncbi:MAG TPA: gluconate 2-dehydrogenase subunit 3 family protein [Emcibacteraceae bacterium]|nr:gluconate 2-dehydrogenase subunit 3 family protein [Emcibacteraceae bacterium]HRW29328.1 gluconate 2-dehydrogenase subunit 3 family protein [Emcibacteraceae bacterium]
MSEKQKLSPNRRRVLQLMAVAGTSAAYLSNYPNNLANAQVRQEGYGQDVDVNNPVVTWDKILDTNQLKNLSVLGDLIIPADDKSPSASHLNITDFVNEWVSAPYPDQLKDRETITTGLERLNQMANKKDARHFYNLSAADQAAMFDELAKSVEAGKASEADDQFFTRLVYLFVGGYYTTDEGMADIGYVGNVPLERFDGPPEEIRKLIGV